jgi:hypothetical protein
MLHQRRNLELWDLPETMGFAVRTVGSGALVDADELLTPELLRELAAIGLRIEARDPSSDAVLVRASAATSLYGDSAARRSGMIAGTLPAGPARASGRSGNGRCEGFRMPARRDLSARAEGRRPKASQEGTRGALGGRSAVYGDLMGRRLQPAIPLLEMLRTQKHALLPDDSVGPRHGRLPFMPAGRSSPRRSR